ncbi:MAG: hypothetical protein R2839_06280 [Thermomicrobiales bacterium]
MAPRYRGELDLAWYARVETEDANVLAAFDWACEAQEAELAVALCIDRHVLGAPRFLARRRGPNVSRLDRRRWIRADNHESALLHGRLSDGPGDYATAKEIGDIALQMARDLGDRRAVAYSLVTLGWNAELREEWSEANRYFEDALHIWTELGECGTQGRCKCFLAGMPTSGRLRHCQKTWNRQPRSLPATRLLLICWRRRSTD